MWYGLKKEEDLQLDSSKAFKIYVCVCIYVSMPISELYSVCLYLCVCVYLNYTV